LDGVVEVLAVVPARGGSKSIPGKNVRLLGEAPLIAYSIAAGLRARHVTRVIVSTDSPQIAAVAQEWGAEVPFLRPAGLALDTSLDVELFDHALTWLDKHEGYRPDVVVQLRPTTPLRPLDCVDAAIEIMLANPDADSVRSVVPSGQNPYKMWRLSDTGAAMTPLLSVEGLDEPYNMPRQQLPPTYWQAGHVDVFRPEVVLAQGSMSGRRIYPLVIDARYSVDIDEPSDWERVEWLLRQSGLTTISPARPTPNGIA
jgi:CMP-N-acetylneuraminic acid synthetase